MSQKRFIQIPILIFIIIGIIVVGGAIYFGTNQYQNYQVQKLAEQKAIEEISQEVEKLRAESQRKRQEKDLEKDLEMERLKEKIEALKKQQAETTKKQKEILWKKEKEVRQDEAIITASEITPYLTGVVLIICDGSEGSGFLYKINNSFYVITNKHVIQNPLFDKIRNINYCMVFSEDKSDKYPIGGLYKVYTDQFLEWNKQSDVAVLNLYNWHRKFPHDIRPINKSNYILSYLALCPSKMQLGLPVVVIGYPSFAKIDKMSSQVITNGIISAYDQTTIFDKLPYNNYFVSAKIDSGSSGGIALSKDESGLCILGIPTWISIGDYETQGIIQNIHNVFYIDN